jgi:hypothetical protein
MRHSIGATLQSSSIVLGGLASQLNRGRLALASDSALKIGLCEKVIHRLASRLHFSSPVSHPLAHETNGTAGLVACRRCTSLTTWAAEERSNIILIAFAAVRPVGRVRYHPVS